MTLSYLLHVLRLGRQILSQRTEEIDVTTEDTMQTESTLPQEDYPTPTTLSDWNKNWQLVWTCLFVSDDFLVAMVSEQSHNLVRYLARNNQFHTHSQRFLAIHIHLLIWTICQWENSIQLGCSRQPIDCEWLFEKCQNQYQPQCPNPYHRWNYIDNISNHVTQKCHYQSGPDTARETKRNQEVFQPYHWNNEIHSTNDCGKWQHYIFR